FFSSRRRHTRSKRDWSSDVCSSDLVVAGGKRDRQVFCPNPGGSRSWNGEGETVPYRVLLAYATLVRFLEIDRRGTHPEQAEGGRSEERRVGKEWKEGVAAYDWKKER